MEKYEAVIKHFQERPDEDAKLLSDIAPVLKEEECVLGIDEAGRGPVLGPMVYACCFTPKSYEAKLRASGHADSKVLTEAVRDKLFEQLNGEDREQVGYAAHIISPNVICNCMLDRAKTNLNAISHNAAIGLIRTALEAEVNVREVFVDTVGPPQKYQEKLAEIFPQLTIVVASKADATYPVVSAASVVAKVTRDAALKRWRFLEKLGKNEEDEEREFGCGYPSDPVTQQYLKAICDPVFGFPQFVRSSWSTAVTLMDARCLPVTWEDTEEEKPKGKRKSAAASEENNGPSLLNFFAKSALKRPGTRHRFFRDRKLARVAGGLV